MTLKHTWESLKIELHAKLVQALNACGFSQVMPVQKAVVPLFSKNYDVAVEACTGSGKTLCFLIPIFNSLLCKRNKNGTPFAVILSPTRELANQIALVASQLGDHLKPFRAVSLVGGSSLAEDFNRIKEAGRADIIVGTIGKMKEMLGNLSSEGAPSFLTFNSTEFLVLDEADRLSAPEYEVDLREIILKFPKQRRTGLFSATLTSAKIKDLIRLGLRNPAMIRLNTPSSNSNQPNSSNKPTGIATNGPSAGDALASQSSSHSLPSTLHNFFKLFKSRTSKIFFLEHFLKETLADPEAKIIVFFNTCASVAFYEKLFKRIGFQNDIVATHGHLKMKKRKKIFDSFEVTNTSRVLMTTDLISRGIDFRGVKWILQVDPPQNPDSFIHRIGRTARAGQEGSALLMVSEKELRFIEYLKSNAISIDEYKGKWEENAQRLQDFNQKMKKIVLSDMDYILKASKAFVALIRSYKEHKLRSVFVFSELEIEDMARSCYLVKIPKLDELRGRNLAWKIDEKELEALRTLKFANKGQQAQFEIKQKQLLEKRQKELNTKKTKQKKAEKEHNKRKVRSQAERSRAKARLNDKEDEMLAAEERLAKKLKKKLITEEEFDAKMAEL